MSEKTEEASPKRLLRAREEGDSGQSAFAAESVGFMVALLVVPGALVTLGMRAANALRERVVHAGDRAPDATLDAAALARDVLFIAAPMLACVALASAAATLLQTRGLFAPHRLRPRLERLSPFRARPDAGRFFTITRAVVFGCIAGSVATLALRAHAGDLARLAGQPGRVPGAALVIAADLAKRVALVGLALAVVDATATYQAFRRRVRMSRAEVRREEKESGGDREIRAARERAHREMASAWDIAAVRSAAVVVAHAHLACALRYRRASAGDAGDVAPVVVATADGSHVRELIAAARAYGVPVVHDERVRELMAVPSGGAIAEASYAFVAEVMRDAGLEGNEG